MTATLEPFVAAEGKASTASSPADVIRRAQAEGGIVAERDPEAEAWIFISLGLLSTIDHRLGSIVGDEFADIVASRREWMTGLADLT
jgi:hypothetical protein